LIERRDFVQRFPHRLIEWHHYRFREKSLDTKASASKLRPGEVILLYFPHDETVRYAERSGLVFEPIPLRANESRVKWLCATPEAPREAIAPVVPLRQRIWRELSRRRRLPFGAVISAVIVIQAWVNTYWLKASLLALVLAVNFLPMLIVGRQYFLVPGGLVRLENGLRFRTPRIELLTPRNSSLVLYADGGAFVATGGKATFIPTDETMIRALIRAWLSTARTPTMSELRTLLAQEGSASSQTANPV